MSGNVTHARHVVPIAVQNGGGRCSNGTNPVAISEIEINPAVSKQKQLNRFEATDIRQDRYRSLRTQDGRIRSYPCIESKAVIVPEVEQRSGRRIRENDFATGPVELECLADHPRGKRHSALNRAVIVSQGVASVSFSAPPTHHVC